MHYFDSSQGNPTPAICSTEHPTTRTQLKPKFIPLATHQNAAPIFCSKPN